MAVGDPKYDAFLKAVREEDPSGGLDWQASVLDKDLSDPPGAPNLGDRYIVAPVGINAWAGHDNDIAEWNGANWDFFSPDEGTAAWVEDEDKTYVFNGTAWVTMGSTMLHGNLQGLLVDDHTQYMLREILDGPLSPMILTGGLLSDGTGVGTLKVAVLSALFRTGVLDTDPLIRDTMAEQDNIAIPLADTAYIVVLNYNGGAPLVTLQIAEPNGTSNINIGCCLKDAANVVHFQNGGWRLSNGLARLHRRAKDLRNCELASGCAIGDDTLQRFSIQPGVVYYGINRLLPFFAGAYHSLADKFVYIYGDDVNGWTYVANQTDIDNLHYYDGAGGLAELSNNNRYACHWAYAHPDDEHVYVVYGTCNGALAEAEQAQPPGSLPPILEHFTALLGCIIIKKNDTSFTTIQMATDRFFTGTAVADHGELAGLDDDDHTQYLLHDGSRAMTGNLDMGAFDIDNATDVNAARHNVPTKKVDCNVFTDAGISACLAELGADGGEVYLPEGTYLCTGTITIPQPNITLRGAGPGTILDASALQDFNVIDVGANDRFTLRNLRIDGDAGTGNPNHLVVAEEARYLTIRNCYFANSDDRGLSLGEADYALIDGNTFSNCDGYGVYFEQGDFARIINNYFTQCGIMLTTAANSNIVAGNTISGPDSSLYLTGAASFNVIGRNIFSQCNNGVRIAAGDNTFVGNCLDACGYETGTRDALAVTAANVSVLGNYFYRSRNTADDVLISGADGCIVIGNKFQSSAGFSERAINIVNSDSCVVQGNYSQSHDTCGLEIDAASTGGSFGGNKFMDAVPVVDAGSGHVFPIVGKAEAAGYDIPTKRIEVEVFTDVGISDALTALGADGGEVYLPEGTYPIGAVISFPQHNITLRGAGRGTILDASAGQGFNVIDLNGKDYCSIKNLTIIGKTGEAGDNDLIYGMDSTNVTIEGCILKSADRYAIALNGADDSTITGNYFELCNGVFLDDLTCVNVSGNIFNGGESAVITAPGAYSVKVLDNQIYDTIGVSIHIQDEMNEARGNYVRNAGSHGIHVENGDRCKVIDNTIYESANDCDDILITGSDNCIVSRNHCFSSAGNSERAIHLATSTDCLVTDNDSEGHDTCGLQMPAGSVNCSIAGNKFRDAVPIVDAASGHLFTIASHAEMYEAKIKVFKQDAEPTLHADDFAAFWVDTNDSNRTYLVFRRGAGDHVLVELT